MSPTRSLAAVSELTQRPVQNRFHAGVLTILRWRRRSLEQSRLVEQVVLVRSDIRRPTRSCGIAADLQRTHTLFRL